MKTRVAATIAVCAGAGLAIALVLRAGAGHRADASGPSGASTSATTSSAMQVPGRAGATAPARVVPARREGQAMVLAESEDALYVADEDHALLRRVVLTKELATATKPKDAATEKNPGGGQLEPTTHDAVETSLKLPGKPAQVLSLGDRLLVTVRDPGLLVMVAAGEHMHELGRVALPDDAWGLALSPDGQTAYVTSAWTRKLSRVAVASAGMEVAWSVDVAREPRGVMVTNDGKRAYVSHLVGPALTSVELAPTAADARVTRVSLPPDPLETLSGETTVSASLAYSLIPSADGRRLFVARHALGAMWSWQGRPTVDGLEIATNEPLAPVRKGKPYGQFTQSELDQMGWISDASGTRAEGDGMGGSQPRAMILRRKTNHLLVVSEGEAIVSELDAMSIAPGLIANRIYRLGGLPKARLPAMQFPPECGAPSAIALSRSEDVAWVYCRSTDGIVAVRLTEDGKRGHRSEVTYLQGAEFHDRLSGYGPFAIAKLAVPDAPPELALGRRLFYDATDTVVSGHMGCAGCHPEGRDDGHVWREQQNQWDKSHRFLAGPSLSIRTEDRTAPQRYGTPRQTPMLVGRVDAVGPYGWQGESATLVDRIKAGFGLHRAGSFPADGQTMRMRADPLARFLRESLVPPPRPRRDPTEQELRGKAIFLSEKAACAKCHAPDKGFTDRSVTHLTGFRTPPLFEADPAPAAYKVPSLLFVGGSEPYYHDGSARTLDELVEKNMDRMGKTSHLSADERAALVAFMRSL